MFYFNFNNKFNFYIWVANSEYWNWFRPYWFILFLGFLITIISCLICFKKRNIPTDSLYINIIYIIPICLIGASIFGKLDFKNLNLITIDNFFYLLFFWEPGMSIHGGLIFGIFFGLFLFYFDSKKYNISLLVYLDLILPNILLGQSIGRWGNFFNHEIMGKPIERQKLMWLPSFIRDNMFKWFVYENKNTNFFYNDYKKAISLLGKPVNVDNFNNIQYYEPIFLYESIINFILWFLIIFIIPFFLKYIYYFNFKKRNINFNKYTFKGIWDELYFDIKPKKIIFLNNFKKKNNKKIKFKNIFKFSEFCKKLEKIQNPNNLIILRCGTKSSLYIIFYNFIRIFLEKQKDKNDIFIKNFIFLNYIIIILFIIFGIIMLIFSQIICVYKFRKWGWLYEKQY